MFYGLKLMFFSIMSKAFLYWVMMFLKYLQNKIILCNQFELKAKVSNTQLLNI
jgi:hypothetical protein